MYEDQKPGSLRQNTNSVFVFVLARSVNNRWLCIVNITISIHHVQITSSLQTRYIVLYEKHKNKTLTEIEQLKPLCDFIINVSLVSLFFNDNVKKLIEVDQTASKYINSVIYDY